MVNEIKTLSKLRKDECMMKHLAKLPIVVLVKETYGEDPNIDLMRATVGHFLISLAPSNTHRNGKSTQPKRSTRVWDWGLG
jgi:hypothetical protein